MKTRKIPMRKEIVSGEMYPKKELVRVVKNKEGEVFLDPTGKQNGRGAYIALDREVAKAAREKRVFEKAFSQPIDPEFYEELYAFVDHQQARKELFEHEQD
ncbi:RNase P modulator RnpM [Fructobacillus parabroussonetiae]|uniref:YlxR family protein n=1 Tax=Fructobacillus parabroussonetiae TaxID=2713174 RepID=A0ABS5QZ49_9LACO|nr:YlxR family protein [Fructobacillus parabroussonetiae]MBS9337182.1 YlxR family protein [Fructobacillus parabroussonetiae]MCK8617134.1 YlxR family protein [Fructobacillus parabroussonetiae]